MLCSLLSTILKYSCSVSEINQLKSVYDFRGFCAVIFAWSPDFHIPTGDTCFKNQNFWLILVQPAEGCKAPWTHLQPNEWRVATKKRLKRGTRPDQKPKHNPRGNCQLQLQVPSPMESLDLLGLKSLLMKLKANVLHKRYLRQSWELMMNWCLTRGDGSIPG